MLMAIFVGIFCNNGGKLTGACLSTCRLQTNSFYPIFPVPYDVTSEVNLDISHAEALKLTDENDYAPDVLVVPSRLKHFTKVCSRFLVAY